jgi:hypothetical protein
MLCRDVLDEGFHAEILLADWALRVVGILWIQIALRKVECTKNLRSTGVDNGAEVFVQLCDSVSLVLLVDGDGVVEKAVRTEETAGDRAIQCG